MLYNRTVSCFSLNDLDNLETDQGSMISMVYLKAYSTIEMHDKPKACTHTV